MTRKQRAQVVKLLRCGADIVHESMIPLSRAKWSLHANDWLFNEAVRVRCAVTAERDEAAMVDGERYRFELLEAAQRVDEGSWP